MNKDMNHIYDEPAQAKTDDELMEWLTNSGIPKTEAEWFAAREFPRLKAENAELKKDNATLKEQVIGHKALLDRLREQTNPVLAENVKLWAILAKYARHTHTCFMGEYNSILIGKGCDCGLSDSLKGVSICDAKPT